MQPPHRLLLTTTLFLALTTARPAHAGLIIQDLSITVEAGITNFGGVSQTSVGIGPPILLTATVETATKRAFSMQTKDGFFQSYASTDGASDNPGTSSGTRFALTVGTDTPDTPLVLDFDFLGGQVAGAAYYGAGNMHVNISQKISAGFNGAVSTVWGFSDLLSLSSNIAPGWSRGRDEQFDTQGIGFPTETLTSLPYVNNFIDSLSLVLHPFHGTLDFGLLQPGQTFTLRYESAAITLGTFTYPSTEASAVASLVDPFSLGGSPPPQLSLQGLTLPTFAGASAPEPGTLALLSLGGGLVLVQRRRAK